MAECDFCLTAVTGPSPIDCERELPWSSDPVVIPRGCFIQGMTDAEAQNHIFGIRNSMPAGSSAEFDEFGNFTYTPSPDQEPEKCGTSSVVLIVDTVEKR